MSYRVKLDLPGRAPLKDKVLLHAKFLRHFHRRKLDDDARGKTAWKMEFLSERERFVIFWKREPATFCMANGFGSDPRFLGMVTIVFSRRDIDAGGEFILVGDWQEIERVLRERAKPEGARV